MPNRRRHKRFIRRCNAEVVVDGSTYKGITSDFSLTGLFIRTSRLLQPQSKVGIKIELPDGSISTVSGFVRRSAAIARGRVMGSPAGSVKKNGIGVELVERDACYLNFMRDIVYETSGIADSPEKASGKVPAPKTSAKKEQNISDMLLEVVSIQQAMINLLCRSGFIDKQELVKEMARVRKK